MLLQILVATALLGLSKNCQAYNENSPNYKWSPQYLGARASPIVYSSQLSAPRRLSRFATVYGIPSTVGSAGYDFEGSLASRNPGFYGYSRTDQIKRSVCVGISDTCAVRSGLMGTLMKLPCCPGSVCTFIGHTFQCVPLDGEKDEYDVPEGEIEYEDQQ